MPRMQAPRGYYTMTQAEKKLNLSSAMIRKHVENGKIKYLLPEGRKQGFYSKKDVDKLAAELEAFLRLEEEAEVVNFSIATRSDIPACIALNRELFTAQHSTDDDTLIKKWTAWIEKNPEVVYILKRDNEVIGIATVLPTTPRSKKFDNALKGDISFLLGDVNITPEDIEEYKAGNHVQLYLAEIGIKQTLEANLRHKLGAKLISKFMDTIVDLGKRGVVIDRILSVGATRSGIRLLQHFGFYEVIFSRSDTRLFILDPKESGAPIMDAYRDALAEYNSTHNAAGKVS
ncbi:hypothetical protein EPA93_19215 [Ktedonosporobacter rubrisoli]|uniref:Helix-turn-helix domain-containing protein n=1 Tax=Ktedonosporobacter rubrisoli TaxID=2509675 RepID=A0A4P6JS25_KTERU|nr:hypothetical protein [Ktedonosporobacter rubrisoli]QBD78010.1 hypothetical protein EPA93_19215 [Ktedonosporobacter rubrisoli]